ncbi:PAS domain S-box-containing protein [Pararhizobium capsulatum DSM 1112]|uniref:histidine kinase n=1 Tax=Pararhizobium capsulatum DSM 1112 TaxID=1121113 RepID=A0ABU0C416_9HYPH|nr:PAS domain S-box protein [Pararhizobium capsulatum]MDQ0323827.1 PAS domain S-box-containing protein [Pararhizobium capsulatum DSM 1112]
MSAKSPALRLRRQFGWLILAAAVPLFGAVLFLGLREFGNARATILKDIENAQVQRRAGLEQIADVVDTHIDTMRAFVAQNLTREAALPEYAEPLDWPPEVRQPGAERGLIVGDPALMTPSIRREITAVTPFFALARAMQASRPYLRWSYFFSESRGFVAIYPWSDPSAMIDPNTPRQSLQGYFDYPLYTLGLPRNDPEKSAYWSPVYVDAGGAGLMVTYAAPVWSGERFRGVVGTDVLLSHLSTLLGGFPESAGQFAVVDQHGNLIATADGRAAHAPAPVPAREMFGATDLSLTQSGFVRRGADLVLANPIAGTPWRLIVSIPDASVTRMALERLMPFTILLLGLAALLALVMRAFTRRFVGPVVQLADFGAMPPDLAATAPPPQGLPAPFRTLAEKIGEAARSHVAQTSHLRAMVDGVPLRVAYLDAGLIYRDVNVEFLNFLELTRDQVIGHHVAEILGPEVVLQYERVTPAIRRSEFGRFEGWIDYIHQGRRYLQVSVLPYQAGEAQLPGFLTFTLDLTEHRQTQEAAQNHLAALTEREARYRSVVVSALDAIIVMDEMGIVLEFNPAAERIFGYSASEAIGQSVGALIVPDQFRTAHEQGLTRYLQGGAAHVIGKRLELQGRNRTGTLLPIELTVTEVRLATGRSLFVSHLRDLTEAKQLERQMQEGRERLYQVEKLSAMGSLLAGVAHELNNPLAIVVAQATLLAEKTADTEMRVRGERIRAAADRCGRIVKSFLAMARQKPPQRQLLAIGEVILNAFEVVGYGLRSSGVETVFDLPDDLPPVLGDRDLLGQVFANLAINAQQALTGQPLSRLIQVTARAEADEIVIRFQDNGPGIAKELAERIFEPYFTTKSVDIGTGIGLSISRNVIESHDGSIALAQGALPGACIEITLPAARTHAEAAPTRPTTKGKAMTVLVVDDEPDVGASLAELIAREGHATTITPSPHEALALLREIRFDAMFTDLRMPGLDGADLARQALSLQPQLKGRIVAVTGATLSNLDPMAPGNEPGFILLEKPFSAEDVSLALQALAAADNVPQPLAGE